MTGKGGIFNILIILAVLMAALTIYLVTRLVNSAKEEAMANAKPPDVEMVTVLVSSADIAAGTEVLPEMVPPKSVPKEFVNPLAVTSFDQIKGKYAASFIPSGDIIFTSKVKGKEQLDKASMVIEKGMRLITLPVDSDKSVAFMTKNGDHVDILATFIVEKFEKDIEGQWLSRQVTITVMQNVRVFDIQYGVMQPETKDGKQSEEAGRLGRGQNVTFEVKPEDADRLTALMAKVSSSFRMTLRRFDDAEIVPTVGTIETELIKGIVSQAPPPSAPVETPKSAPSKPKYNY